MLYRKRPVEIAAEQYTGNNLKSIRSHFPKMKIAEDAKGGKSFIIFTLECQHIAIPGDWIIQGVKGEYYPCKPDIFEMTYEPASSEETS